MRILVCGSRNWTDRDLIRNELSSYSGEVSVIHGGARGADAIAGEIAEELGFNVIVCPANWKRFGRAAGPIRNKQMLDQHSPDHVLAFVDSRSVGTRHMIEIARKAGISCSVFEQSD